jgi:1,2-diacylglycerol 3-beta-galactosyltransferase
MPNSKKHILILTSDAGFGHRSVANAVALGLQGTHPDECTVDVVNPLEDRRVPAMLRDSQADYDRMVREIPRLYQFGMEASDTTVPFAIVQSALVVMLYEVLWDILRRTQPDVIVVTYPMYHPPLQAIFTMRRMVIPTITTITDLGYVHGMWFNKKVDLLLVGSNLVRAQAIACGIPARKIHVTGIPVHPELGHSAGTLQERRAELGWEPNLTTFLGVGSRRVGNLPELANVLNHSGLPIQLVLVAGGDMELLCRFQEIHWHIPAHIYGYVDNMPTLMHAADAIISKAGGLIVTEALACGLPMLLVDVIPGQEVGNAEFVVSNGAGEVVSDCVAGLEVVCHWMEQNAALLAERTANARRLGKPNAAYQTAELTWQMAQRGAAKKTVRTSRGSTRLRKLLDRFQVPWKEKN